MTWTDARIAELVRLWQGGVSAGGIAETLGDGVSRSAVLGKLHRLGLLGSRKAAAAPRRYAGSVPPAPAPALASGRPPPPPLRLAEVPSAPPVTAWRTAAFVTLRGTTPRPWLTREFGECAFPVDGEGAATLSCCAPVRRGSVYCAAHHRIAYKAFPPSAREEEQREWARAVERWAA
jgi:GcrA cell cycle regulator